MTNDKMFDEIGCPDELKKCKEEIKRHKKHIQKLSNQLLDYERIIEEKENEIAANLSESNPEADVFAKFKKYNTRRSSNVVTKTDIMIKTSYNKFKLKGKIHDFDDNSSKSENTKTNEPRPISYEEYKKTKTM